MQHKRCFLLCSVSQWDEIRAPGLLFPYSWKWRYFKFQNLFIPCAVLIYLEVTPPSPIPKKGEGVSGVHKFQLFIFKLRNRWHFHICATPGTGKMARNWCFFPWTIWTWSLLLPLPRLLIFCGRSGSRLLSKYSQKSSWHQWVFSSKGILLHIGWLLNFNFPAPNKWPKGICFSGNSKSRPTSEAWGITWNGQSSNRFQSGAVFKLGSEPEAQSKH